ncbi:putative Tigger transposable element-derived protein 1-like 313 [Homarus americanus]|uniref:Putative Tigger transposable element-derived protein 1-like 313 n=1 Tax=Homarus americanus TaxID=6706 RepID=A0A8J5JCB5_HOMAM|nr:putative Tigger transposable element-derived protein 1-like 313 [Homarus americanus]
MLKFSIADCISIKQCHDDLAALCVNSCWKALWPEMVNDFTGSPTVDQDVQHNIQLACQMGGEGFNDLQKEEVQEELLDHAGEELTEEKLAKLVEKQHREDEEEEGEVEEVPTLTVTSLNRCLLASKALVDMILDTDPSIQRTVNFKRGMENLLLLYKEIMKELKCKVAHPHVLLAFIHSMSYTFYIYKSLSLLFVLLLLTLIPTWTTLLLPPPALTSPRSPLPR